MTAITLLVLNSKLTLLNICYPRITLSLFCLTLCISIINLDTTEKYSKTVNKLYSYFSLSYFVFVLSNVVEFNDKEDDDDENSC